MNKFIKKILYFIRSYKLFYFFLCINIYKKLNEDRFTMLSIRQNSDNKEIHCAPDFIN